MVAFIAIRVHHRFLREHKIDEKVFKSMRREQVIGILGIAFIVAEYIIQSLARF